MAADAWRCRRTKQEGGSCNFDLRDAAFAKASGPHEARGDVMKVAIVLLSVRLNERSDVIYSE